MRKNLISIIIPVHNVEQYLRQCIDSVINQTYKNLEIILVNDGSTDNSGKICDEYAAKDNRIEVIHKQNGGVSSARNVGLDVATGDYIGFVDSDDYIEQDMYEYLFSINKKNNTSLAVCNFYIVKDENILTSPTIVKHSVLSAEEMLECSFKQLFSWNKLIARKLFENLRFPEDVGYGEDMAVCMNLFIRAEKISYGKKTKYFYIQRKNSAVHTQQWDVKSLGYFKSTDIILEYAKKKNLNNLQKLIKFSQTNKAMYFLKYCLITEPIDYKSAELLKNYLKKNLKNLLINKVKFTKKIFVIISFININLASKICRLMIKLKIIK